MPRSSEYSERIAARICEQLIQGKSLRTICKAKSMPSATTVFVWLARFPAFADQYARAREAQADALFDEILDIADTPQIGKKVKTLPGGKKETTTGDMIEHRRLQVDARKWMAGKMAPKKYGEKLDLNVAGSLQTMSQEDLDARITELLGKAGTGATPAGAGKAKEP